MKERARPLGGWLAFSLLLATGLFALVWLEQRATPARNRPPPVSSPDQGVDGLSARTALADGEIGVRLSPLHPDVERQRFDARALRERLALGPGEPWRLRVAWQSRGGAPLEIGGELAVADELGLALTTIGAIAVAADDPSEPVRRLLAHRARRVESGGQVDVVLWGREPGGGATVEGLNERVALSPATFRRGELEEPLARLDSRAGAEPAR